MNRLRLLVLFLGSLAIVFLSAACGSPAQPAAPAAPPLPTPADLDEVPRIAPETLKERLDQAAEILVVDTRGQSDYEGKHIPGAVRFTGNFDDLARDRAIVIYCA